MYTSLLLQTFNSKQALNGHIRIHGGTTRGTGLSAAPGERESSPRPPASRNTPSPASNTSEDYEDANGVYPCKVCGR